MRKFAGWAVGLLLAVTAVAPLTAQSNDDDYTPLNSRIKRDQQYPTDVLPKLIPQDKLTKVDRDEGHSIVRQFSACLYTRSKSAAVNLIERTDFGFQAFQQVGMVPDAAAKTFGFKDCLERVAQMNGRGVILPYNAPSLRQWLLQAAYLERYPHGPAWVKPGYVAAPRAYPISAANRAVHAAMDFADCVVAADPGNADYFYRTGAGSADEQDAIKGLSPALGSCLPQGQQLQLSPVVVRAWLGEALWHAATHSVAAPLTASASGH